MKLYSFSGSCALATNIALEWIGKPFTVKMLQRDELATPEYHKINPNGQVPVIDEDGWILAENAAVLNYLADTHPEARLGGDGTARSRAEVNQWLAMINSDMHPTYKPLFGTTSYLGDAAMIEKSKADSRQQLRTYFERLDHRLEGRDWLAGSRSIADPYLFVLLLWAKIVKVDISGLANLHRFEQHMRKDAGVQRALKTQGLGEH